MKQSDDRKPIVGALFRGVIRLLSWLPLRYAQAIGAGLGWLLWRVPNSVKRISEKNIALAFADQSAEQQEQLVKASLIELGKTATELGPLWCWSKQRLLPLVKEVRGAERIESALAQGRGVIVLSPHLGAWEMMGWYWSVQYPITSLYRPPRIGSIENFMRQVRERSGATLVPTDMSGVKALRKALKNNEIVGILPDQDPGKAVALSRPFLVIRRTPCCWSLSWHKKRNVPCFIPLLNVCLPVQAIEYTSSRLRHNWLQPMIFRRRARLIKALKPAHG